GRAFLREGGLVRRRGCGEVTRHPFEVAFDAVGGDGALDEIDRGRMAGGSQARTFAAVPSRETEIAIVESVGKVCRRARGDALSDAAIVDHDHVLAAP